MRAAVAGLAGLFLSLCVLWGTWGLLYGQLELALWLELAIAAVVGAAAGTLASRDTPAWLAWLTLVVLAWAAYAWAALYLMSAPRILPCLVYPLAASVGVAAGLVARRAPTRFMFGRVPPLVICAAVVTGIVFLHAPLVVWGQLGTWKSPPFTLQLASGKQISLQALSGKTLVLSFWATWCGPCREELPALERLYRNQYAGRKDVRFFLVNEDRGPAGPVKAEHWLERHGVTMPLALDTSGVVSRTLKLAPILPARAVIGPQGRVRFVDYGYGGDGSSLSKLRQALADIVREAQTDSPVVVGQPHGTVPLP